MTRTRRVGSVAALAVVAMIITGCSAATPAVNPASVPATLAPVSPQAAAIDAVIRQQIDELSMRAVIVQVKVGDDLIVNKAYGDSMVGVPATTDMHFRNGAVAFEYISNLLLQYVDDGTVGLDDTIATWAPDLPEANQVTLRMLANQTAGYPDYETDPGWNAAYNADPFHEFTYDERLAYAFSRPVEFPPGTNWSYSHTNFMVLGQILTQIGGAPLDQLIRTKVLDPLGLTDTVASDTSYIPEPVLHAYSSERRQALQIPKGVDFTEEATYWNPAWGTPPGAAETTTITDLTTTAIAIGTGALLSDKSFHEMTDSKLIGFGKSLPSCGGSCFTQINAYNYGLGVVRSGSWTMQNPSLSGYAAVAAYLPSQKISISVATTYAPDAYNSDGTYGNVADRLFRAIGAVVAPTDPPPASRPSAPRY